MPGSALIRSPHDPERPLQESPWVSPQEIPQVPVPGGYFQDRGHEKADPRALELSVVACQMLESFVFTRMFPKARGGGVVFLKHLPLNGPKARGAFEDNVPLGLDCGRLKIRMATAERDRLSPVVGGLGRGGCTLVGFRAALPRRFLGMTVGGHLEALPRLINDHRARLRVALIPWRAGLSFAH